MDLHSGEVTAHIKAGKLVRRLALTWDERMGLVLDADLSVKRLKFLDVVPGGAPTRPEADSGARSGSMPTSPS
ncbi:MAG: recombination-associated protein RdgC [Arhodomonas sp.]|nr:recombination-associated protein RdgC [Arhodomonas sp.]